MYWEWNIHFLCGLIVFVSAETPPTKNAWNLRYSEGSRSGRFLSIPLHYGDWVPIGKAKALVEDLIKGVNGHDKVGEKEFDSNILINEEDILVAPEDVAQDRIDHGEPIYVNTHPKNQYGFPFHRKPSTPVRFQDQHYGRYKYQKPNNRGYRKLPPPNLQKSQQIWYKGSSKQPILNSKKYSVKPFTQPHSSSSLVNKQVTAQTSLNTNQVNSYLESLNAIQTIPAPDLSKYGPPVIELGTGTDGEIILGRPANKDHLAGFVSRDFDEFSSGDFYHKKPKKQNIERLSLLVGGDNDISANDESGLVSFLNNEGEKAETFVIQAEKSAPEGFSKINLPFMDPTKHKGNLPKAFIAPKGIPIPEGYKGKPLPPTPSAEQTSTESVLLIQVPDVEKENKNKLKPVNLFSRRPTKSFLRHNNNLTEKPKITSKATTTPKLSSSLRYKLQKKKRPSLTEFYLKKKAEKIDKKKNEPQKKSYFKKPYEKTYLNNKRDKETQKETIPTTKFEFTTTNYQNNVVSTKEINIDTENLTIALDETD